ncbi:TonB-dependent receptor domain-containing protein [Dyadobacter sp. BHUBP1]|uniref:TonB-dependent receptor domain-containing protein n=1 Tax=Dyadobacter sp. BHUBP1 TaxID=3424178 RepID=UPI003D347E3A
MPVLRISGIVWDSAGKVPMNNVSVLLGSIGTDSMVALALTDKQGAFVLSGPGGGPYELRISCLGYGSKVLRIPMTANSHIRFDSLQLSARPVSLHEVTVTTQKNPVQYEADRLIYTVANDPTNANLNTFELFRKIPMLTINGDDGIELNGSSSFLVLLNNRPSSLFVSNVEEALRSLPANSVKSIEVITSPPARYESEGIGGIINIVTYRRNVTGYSGSARAGYSAPGGPVTSGSVQAKAGGLGFAGIWSLANSRRPTTTNSLDRLDKLFGTILQQAGQNKGNYENLNLSGELSWQVDDRNLLNIHYNSTRSTSESLSDTRVNIRDMSGKALQSYRSLNTFNSVSPGHDWGFDYQLGFKKNSQQLLTFSFRELENENSSHSQNRIAERLNAYLRGGVSENSSRFTERTAQIDYVQPIKNHSLEIGLKTILRSNNSSYFFDHELAGTSLFTRDSSLTNQYDNRQTIHAGYVSVSLKWGPWLLRTGTRVEQTRVAANFRTTGTLANQYYFNVVPNAAFSRKFGTSTNLSLSYNQRLQRPSLFFINPFVNNQNPYNIFYGNPSLNPTVSHVVNLNFNTFTGKTNFSLNLNHNFTNNAILQFTTIGADTVARTTFGNVGSESGSGLSLGISSTFLGKLFINLNNSINYRRFRSRTDQRQTSSDGLTYSSLFSAGYTFTKSLRANAAASYTSASLSFQARSIGFFSHNLSLNYSFLKDKKGDFTFSAVSPFIPSRQNRTVTEVSQFSMVSTNAIIMHRYMLTFTYRFGKLQGGFKRKKRGILNDDLMGQ